MSTAHRERRFFRGAEASAGPRLRAPWALAGILGLIGPVLLLEGSALAQTPGAEVELSRRVSLEGPTILWSDDAHWGSEPAMPLGGIGDALAPASTDGETLPQLILGPAGRLVLLDSSGLIAVAVGPQQLRISAPEPGRVALSRVGHGEGADNGTRPDIVTFPVPGGWSEGHFPPLPSHRSPTLSASPRALDEASLTIITPSDRSMRPSATERGPRLAWQWFGPDEDARFDIEIAEVNDLDQPLATVERWWRIGGRALQLWHPWRSEGRYRISIETAPSRGPRTRLGASASKTIEVLSTADISRLDAIDADLDGRSAALGQEATRVLRALALERFGLDSEARAIWFRLLIERPDHPQAEAFLFRALADP